MQFFGSLKLKWVEPESFRLIRFRDMQVELRKVRWKFLSLFSLFAAAAFAGFMWCMNMFVFDPNPKPFGLYFAGLGSFFWVVFYGLPYNYLWFSGETRLFSKCIVQSESVWFKWITDFRWSPESGYYVLCLLNKRGFVHRYGVPDQETRDKIEAALIKIGLNKIQDERQQ